MVEISTRQDLTQECKSLIAVDAIAVPVFVRLTEVSLVQAAVTETRVVVLCGFLISTLALEAIIATPIAVVLSLLVAFVVTRIQSGLAKFSRAAKVAVTIPVAAAASLVAGVIAVRVSVAIVANASALVVTVEVVSVRKCFAKVAAVDLAVAKT